MPPRPLLLLAAAALLSAQPVTKTSQVDALFEQYRAKGSPGCAVGVLEEGVVMLQKGYGLADLDHELPITPATTFYMASVSKQFTAVSVLLAERDGKLKLEESIRKYIPELPSYADKITIHRMLDHTAGLRDVLALWGLKGWSTESVLQERPSLDLIARQKALNYNPGDEYSYSNTGYLLAAIALHRATGQRLGDFAKERIFDRLSMSSTRFQHDHGLPIPNRANGYTKRDGGWRTANLAFDLAGSGGLYSNIEDMMIWARNFEQPRVAGDLLGSLQLPVKMNNGEEPGGGYALGLVRKKVGEVTTISHSGGAVGYSTFFLRVPEKNLTVVCLCNSGGAPVARHAHQIADIYTGLKLTPVEPATPPPAAAATATNRSLIGTYWSEELETVWRIVEDRGKLLVRYEGGDLEVKNDPKGGYRAGGMTLKPGAGGGLVVDVGRARGIVFTRK